MRRVSLRYGVKNARQKEKNSARNVARRKRRKENAFVKWLKRWRYKIALFFRK